METKTDKTKRHADELFKEFKEISVTEFFRKNRAHLGYSGKLRSLTTVIHEVVTNSLDATEEGGILPEINVKIEKLGEEHYRFIEQDNGPGIPVKHISRVFGQMLAGTKFHRNVQLRGQQGIGVAGVTLFSQMSTGKPIKIRTSTGDGKVHELKLMIDITKNKADIIDQAQPYIEYWTGTEIEGELKGVKYTLGERGPFEYLRRTAIANPHARITFIDPEGRKTVFERSSEDIPKPPKVMKPHPKGMDVDELINMSKATKARTVKSFLITSFSRISSAKTREIQDIIGIDNLDLRKNPRRLTWEECEKIVNAFEQVKFLAPPMEGLQPIDGEHIRNSVLSILDPEFDVVLTRSPKVYSGGIPFQVEVAVAYGGHAGRNIGEGTKVEIMRFANRAPLLFDAGGCAITKAVNGVEWKRYGIRDFDNSPTTIFVNIVSTHIPYISAGKQSISDDKEIVKEIKMALMDVGRKFQLYYSRKRKAFEKEARRQILLKYSTELAAGLADLIDGDEDKILGNLTALIEEKLRLESELEALEEEEVEEPIPEEEINSEEITEEDMDIGIEEVIDEDFNADEDEGILEDEERK